ncbi:MAG: DnaB-like helicase C-terminal domain-containing protein [Candidatus Pacebacteria bacterium]|nr:DnaB-like helicase C-terminal domain-containing protein [Candidatus Paceibacterota bacterium]
MNISDINDVQAESGTISTLLYHPDFILHSSFLKPSHFYDKKNGCIYWAIQELYKSGVDKIDSFNLSSMINSDSRVKKKMQEFDVKTLDELIELARNVTRGTVKEYLIVAREVATSAFKRKLHTKLVELENDCCDSKYTLDDLNTKAYDSINNIAEEFVLTEKVQKFGDKIDGIVSDIKSRQCGNKHYGIPSKFESFNKYCPFERQELVLFEAKRKTGKSIIMMNEAVHKLKNNIPCVYFDTEMSDRNFTERLLANLTGVPVYKIKSGSYSPSEGQMIDEAIEFIKKAPFVHLYEPVMTNDKIYSTCKILQYKMGLQFVLYDYLKSSESDSSRQYNDLGNKTNFLKNNIGGELNLAVCAAAQLNRSGEIGDSWKIEQYVSSAIVIEQKSPEEIATDGAECGNYKAFIKLNRNGEQMAEGEYIDLVFDGNTATINEAKQQHKKTDGLPI